MQEAKASLTRAACVFLQVHVGQLRSTGQQVAVKVQHASARKAMCSDLTNLRLFSNLLTRYEGCLHAMGDSMISAPRGSGWLTD